jgi:hypothetical protein
MDKKVISFLITKYSPETEQEIIRTNIEKEHVYMQTEEQREYAVSLINRGMDPVSIWNKKVIADSIHDIVKKFSNLRKPHTKDIPLFNSRFEVL